MWCDWPTAANMKEDRCFAAANSPAHLRQTNINSEQFERLLKTFLFGCWDRGVLWLTVKLSLPSHFTYLLTSLHIRLEIRVAQQPDSKFRPTAHIVYKWCVLLRFLADRTLVTVELLPWLLSVRPSVRLSTVTDVPWLIGAR